MTRRAGGAVLALAALLACARPSTPPGGETDRIPPRVVSVFPAPFDTLTDLRAPVVIEFDERLSIQLQGVRDWSEAVLVSPLTGDLSVRRGRRSLEVSMAGGWRPGLVYRVVVLPVFRDRFGNQRREPVELVFTTGAPIPPTAVAGFVEDRLTGLPVPDARVEATRRLDSVVYVAVSDTSGFFSLRNIPAGAYDVLGWLDRDRDRTADFQEPRDERGLALGFQDTAVFSMALLPMDTTPARLLRAEPIDSLRVRLFFDDHFPTGRVAGGATVFRLPDSIPVAEGELLHPAVFDSIQARERAVADSIRAAREDSLLRAAGDTLAEAATAAVPDTTAPGRRAQRLPPVTSDTPDRRGQAPGPPRRGPGAAGPGRGSMLPSRELVLVLPDPLRPETAYVVEVRGLTNIRELPGGGGSARFRTPARPDTAAAVPADSAG